MADRIFPTGFSTQAVTGSTTFPVDDGAANGKAAINTIPIDQLNATIPLSVPKGGSGAATLTGLVKGNGAGAMTAVAAPTGAVVGTTDAQTLTNKRRTKRVVTEADATSITPAGDTTDICYQLNTQATGTLTINAPTGTPVDGDILEIKLLATNVQTFSWNAIYRGGTDLALPTVSTAAKIDRMIFEYDAVGSKWDIVGLVRGN